MLDEHLSERKNIDPILLSILIQNPYFSQVGDEIGETTLINWIKHECRNHPTQANLTISKEEIHGLITKLIFEEVLSGRMYGQKMLLSPTQNYFLLKKGKPIVKREAKTHMSLFEDNHNHLEIQNTKNNASNDSGASDEPPNTNETLISTQLPQNHNMFYHQLVEYISNYDGQDKDVVKYLPGIFKLSCNILNDKYSDWHTKVLISSALGYCVLGEDVILDRTEFGYLDDLYILCYALREIKRYAPPSLFYDNWQGQEDIDIYELIEEIYRDAYIVVQDYACEILHKVGLRKFIELNLEEYEGTYHQKISKLAREKRELLALTAYLVKIVYHTNVDGRSLKKIKNFLARYGDYTEIKRLIELSNRDYEVKLNNTTTSSIEDFEVELERKLHQARLRALLEDKDTEYEN